MNYDPLHIPAAFEQNDLLVPDISISPEEVERTLLDVCVPLTSRKDKISKRNKRVLECYRSTYVDQ